MIKVKIVNPVGDIVAEIEIPKWIDIETFKASNRIILESNDGSIYNYSAEEWIKSPPQIKI